MPALWLTLLFGIWLAIGFLIWKRSAMLKVSLAKWSRSRRIGFAMGALFFGAALLLAGFYAIGLIARPSPTVVFLLFGLLGSVFVALQTVAGVCLVTLLEEAVTTDPHASSITQDRKETQ